MFNIDQPKQKLKIFNIKRAFQIDYILCENISKCFLLDVVQYLTSFFPFCFCCHESPLDILQKLLKHKCIKVLCNIRDIDINLYRFNFRFLNY